MRQTAALTLVLAAALCASACERGQNKRDKRTPSVGQVPTTQPNTPQNPGGAHSASLTARFAKADLAASGVSTAALTYDFSYLSVQTNGAIDFEGKDTADVEIAPSLPVGQGGKLTLDLKEGGVVKLHGEKADVTLAAGENELDLELVPVDAPASTAKLKLKLKIAQRPQPQPQPQPDGTQIPAGWDGKTFRGNASWDLSASAN